MHNTCITFSQTSTHSSSQNKWCRTLCHCQHISYHVWWADGVVVPEVCLDIAWAASRRGLASPSSSQLTERVSAQRSHRVCSVSLSPLAGSRRSESRSQRAVVQPSTGHGSVAVHGEGILQDRFVKLPTAWLCAAAFPRSAAPTVTGWMKTTERTPQCCTDCC